MPEYNVSGKLNFEPTNKKKNRPDSLCGCISVLFIIVLCAIVFFPELRVRFIDAIDGDRSADETCDRISYLQGRCEPE